MNKTEHPACVTLPYPILRFNDYKMRVENVHSETTMIYQENYNYNYPAVCNLRNVLRNLENLRQLYRNL